MFINPILALLPLISVTQGKSPPFPLFSTKIGGSLPPGAAATGAGGLNKTVSGANGTGNGTGNSSDSGGYMRVDGVGRIVSGLMLGLIGCGWVLV